jgi:peptidoglycan/LPS O-acetylase OafA/YrhL
VPGEVRTLPYYLVFFLIGLLISRAIGLREVRASGLPSVLLTAGFILPFLLYPNIYAALFGRSGWLLTGDLQQMWHDPRYPIAAGLCLLAALCSPLIKVGLSAKGMIYLGKISYSVYLLHFPVIDVLARFMSPPSHPTSFLVATLIATTCVSALSHRMIEKPGNRLVQRAFHGVWTAIRLRKPAPKKTEIQTMDSNRFG